MSRIKPLPSWIDNAFIGLHYDLHARATDTCLGAELTHEHLRREFEKVSPDFVQCDCKGHGGYTSYPTKVGSPAPGIVKDALRIHRDVTRELGIPLLVHYSGIWDTRALELHPEWAAVNCEGKPIYTLPDSPSCVCMLGPYLDELMIPQLLEIVDEYDVDGFWVDGDNWAVRDCYCDRCRAEFKKRTGIGSPPLERSSADWAAWPAPTPQKLEAYRSLNETIAEKSITVVRTDGNMPANLTPGAKVLTVTVKYPEPKSFLPSELEVVDAELEKRGFEVDHLLNPSHREIFAKAHEYEKIFFNIFILPHSHPGTVRITGKLVLPFWRAFWIDHPKAIFTSFGSPYHLYEMPHLPNMILAYGPTESSQKAAVKAWLGEMPARGICPVKLPIDASQSCQEEILNP